MAAPFWGDDVVRTLWRAAHRDAPDDARAIGMAAQVLLVLRGVRKAARLDQGRTTSLQRAVRRLAAQHPSHLQLLLWGDGREPLVLDPSRCSQRDVAVVAAARRGDSDVDSPLSGAMGRLLGYACRYEPSADARAWTARGVVELHVHFMRDGVELPRVWLGAFGCGPSVGRRAFDRLVARTRRHWQLAANRSLAGTTCKTPDGRTWVVSRFTVTATPGDSSAVGR